MAEKRTTLGKKVEEGLKEALAWKRGELELEVVEIDPMPKGRVKAIRKGVARSAKAFEARFGIPAATINNWEQGRRRPGPSERLLLEVIARDPGLVERVARDFEAAAERAANENQPKKQGRQRSG
jgi:putative transcriptional regulator